MKKVLVELDLSLEELLNILSEKFDIVISDIEYIDDEVINELYTIVYNSKLTWSELINKEV